jgi:hypothetical protein
MSLVNFAFTQCKEAFRIQDESELVPIVASIHRFLSEPFHAHTVLDRYSKLLLKIKTNGAEVKTHNRLTRTLILTLAGYQLHFSKGTFTYNDMYTTVQEMLRNSPLSLWSGSLSSDLDSFKAQIRTAIHEHCPDSCQFWFRHGRMTQSYNDNNQNVRKTLMQYHALFSNDHMVVQNRIKGWSKGNAGKKRNGTSTFRFNLNLDEPSSELVDEIAIAYGNRLDDNHVYRIPTRNAKTFYHTNLQKNRLY